MIVDPIGVREDFGLPGNAITNGHAARFVDSLRRDGFIARIFNHNRTCLLEQQQQHEQQNSKQTHN